MTEHTESLFGLLPTLFRYFSDQVRSWRKNLIILGCFTSSARLICFQAPLSFGGMDGRRDGIRDRMAHTHR